MPMPTPVTAPDAAPGLRLPAAYDLLDVPTGAGHRVLLQLERLGTPLGPVLTVQAPGVGYEGGRLALEAKRAADRLRFFVEAGTTASFLADLKDLGWDPADTDIRTIGVVLASETRLPAVTSPRWVRPPEVLAGMQPFSEAAAAARRGAAAGPAAAGGAGARLPADRAAAVLRAVRGEPVRVGPPGRSAPGPGRRSPPTEPPSPHARMSPMEFLVIGIIIAAIAVIGATALLYRARGRRRPVETPPAPPSVPSAAQEAPSGSGDTAVAERAPPSASPTVAEAEALPEIEVPEPTAGRLVRLRSRLSRSQGTLGQGLLKLLSRDKLDEATWEEIEDTLIAADLGVGPASELVARLRTRTRVQGARTVTRPARCCARSWSR